MATEDPPAPVSLLDLPAETLRAILTEAYSGLGSSPTSTSRSAFLARIAVENSCRALRDFSCGLPWKQGDIELSWFAISSIILHTLKGLQRNEITECAQSFVELFLIQAPWRLSGFDGIYLSEGFAEEFDAQLLEGFLRGQTRGLRRRSDETRRRQCPGPPILSAGLHANQGGNEEDDTGMSSDAEEGSGSY